MLSSPTQLADALLLAMQVSVLLPLAKAWHHRVGLPRPLRWLGWYFPLSVVSALLGRWLPLLHLPNLYTIIAFNVGKTLVLGLVLRQVLADRWALGLSDALLLLGPAAVVAAVAWLPLIDATTTARLTQCVVLTVIALAYLEQASRLPTGRLSADPYFWLCVGQLGYAAATVAVFGTGTALYYAGWQNAVSTTMALAGLYQNYTLWQVYAHAPAPGGHLATPRLP